MVRVGVGVRPDHDERHPAVACRPGGHDLEHGVLRNRPADDDAVRVGGESEVGDRCDGCADDLRCAVGDGLHAPCAEVTPQIRGDDGVIADEHVTDETGETLVAQEDGLFGEPPAPAGPLHPVHVDHVRDAAKARHDVEDAGVVSEGQPHITLAVVCGGVADRDEVEVGRALPAFARFRNEHPFDPVPAIRGDVAVAVELAVHHDVPAPIAQVHRDMLCGSLEPAVGGGDAVRAENADRACHQYAPSGRSMTRTVRHMRTMSVITVQFSTYRRSSRTLSSQLRSLRPPTCQGPVMPGLM